MERSTSGRTTTNPVRESTTYPIQTRRDIARKPVPARVATRPSFMSSCKTWWTLLSGRARIVIYTAIFVLCVLIVGLSAGLARRGSRVQNLPLPSSHGGPYTGDLTYYDPALGACGLISTSADKIVAVSHLVYDAVSVGTNPNMNPLCGKKIRARRNDRSVDLTVVDRCTGCQATDIDVTRSVFSTLAVIDEGRVNVEWAWLEDVPANATG